MKTKLIFFGMLCFNLQFGQSTANQATGGVSNGYTSPAGLGPQLSEIFRFRSGLVTQLDQGSNFTQGNQWFALGRLSLGPAAIQAFYGARFQTPNNALTMGFTSTSPNNPRIEWIGNGASTGNLEFRVGLGFGVAGTPAENRLVATMNSDGSTVFGANINFTNPIAGPSKVTIVNGESIGLSIDNTVQLSFQNTSVGFSVNQNAGFVENVGGEININNSTVLCENTGLRINTSSGSGGSATGITSFAAGNTLGSIGIRGEIDGASFFGAGLYGRAPQLSNQWAGFFDGRVFATSYNRPSDRRLKYEIAPALLNLERIAQTQSVTYKYIKTEALNLDGGLQHGFIAQDFEKIFPELVTEVNKPVFDKDGKVKEMFKFKTVDYMGMISILAGGIKELNAKVEELEKKLANSTEKFSRKSISPSENTKGIFMQQNTPNPFGDQTTISYQLPEGTNTAEIMVFDLNGRLIKTFPINKNQSELTIKASEIGSGLFIYSLVQNGQELLSKKMIVK